MSLGVVVCFGHRIMAGPSICVFFLGVYKCRLVVLGAAFLQNTGGHPICIVFSG